MQVISDPSILYFGTPVVLPGTVNECGTYNLAPISSIYWLGWRCMIGISAFSQTASNILRSKQCVLNLPSEREVSAVNRLALTTGTNPVPARKQAKGYRFEPDKFRIAGLTPKAGDLVSAPRALECPVQLEATLSAVHEMAGDNPEVRGRLLSIELRIVRVHLDPAILLDDSRNRIDPDKWRPLIMSFQHFYPLGTRLQLSRLATIPEEQYRTPEIPDVHTTTGSFIHPKI